MGINRDAISNGDLILEEVNLTEEFKKAYSAHCRSKRAYLFKNTIIQQFINEEAIK